MLSAFFQSASDRGLFGRRTLSFLLALLLELLLILGFLTLTPLQPGKDKGKSSLNTFTVAPSAERADKKPQKNPRKVVAKQAPVAPAPPTPPIIVPHKNTVTLPGVLPIDLAQADIAKFPSKGDSSDSADNGSDSKAPYGPGEGPNGQPLYQAEWYREPSHAELATYTPPNIPSGAWALIACKTIENYRVENCRSLGESPVGSGLARGMREAAWQFRVRPPRVGGKTLVGAWVRIRIDFNQIWVK